MNIAVFFDKDGVLNIDSGINPNPSETVLFDEAGDIIAYCRERKYKIFIITNQPVVARGLISEVELARQLEVFKKMLLDQNRNALVDGVYYCPHHPNADIAEYRVNCECRKPKPGLILKAINEYNIDIKKSFMVGDRISDIIAGNLSGCKTILCETGMHKKKMIETDMQLQNGRDIKPNFIIRSISELRNVIQ